MLYKEFETWAKESFEIATKIPYQNVMAAGTRKRKLNDCGEIDAALMPAGYAKTVGRIADRRIMLAGYRLTDTLKRLVGVANGPRLRS
jgi:hypothetical protein